MSNEFLGNACVCVTTVCLGWRFRAVVFFQTLDRKKKREKELTLLCVRVCMCAKWRPLRVTDGEVGCAKVWRTLRNLPIYLSSPYPLPLFGVPTFVSELFSFF